MPAVLEHCDTEPGFSVFLEAVPLSDFNTNRKRKAQVWSSAESDHVFVQNKQTAQSSSLRC